VTLPMPRVTLLQWHRNAAAAAGCRVWHEYRLATCRLAACEWWPKRKAR